MRRIGLILVVTLVTFLALKSFMERGEPLSANTVDVVDGDTIRARGRTIRLVGIDTPEMGNHAHCERERELAARATVRLRQLAARDNLDLRLVPCACPRGTEGTPACNYGRACGVLRSGGRDVADILIAERLARRYECGRSSCPPRSNWCS
jgi:endonuclease YncB( thermonuclease family)